MNTRLTMRSAAAVTAISLLTACGQASATKDTAADVVHSAKSLQSTTSTGTSGGSAAKSTKPTASASASTFDLFPNASSDAKRAVSSLQCPTIQESRVSEATGVTMFRPADPENAGDGGIFGCDYSDVDHSREAEAARAPGEIANEAIRVNFGGTPVSLQALRKAAHSTTMPGTTFIDDVPGMPGAIEVYGEKVYGGGMLLDPGCGITTALGPAATATVNVVQVGADAEKLCAVAKTLMQQWSTTTR